MPQVTRYTTLTDQDLIRKTDEVVAQFKKTQVIDDEFFAELRIRHHIWTQDNSSIHNSRGRTGS